MFGCSEHWIGKRFSHALTTFLCGERERQELAATDAVDAGALERRYDSWRVDRATALRAGGAVAAYAMRASPCPKPRRPPARPTSGPPRRRRFP